MSLLYKQGVLYWNFFLLSNRWCSTQPREVRSGCRVWFRSFCAQFCIDCIRKVITGLATLLFVKKLLQHITFLVLV